MTAVLVLGVCAVGSYLLGSIPTGYLWAKARGVDIRTVGSGNIGATNVMRVFGKAAGITVLLLDTAKGFLPVWLAPSAVPTLDRSMVQIVCGIAVVAGHNWTCWLKFRGGKGIATSAGALLAMLPGPLAVGMVVWGVAFGLSRYVSVASLVAAVAVPVATWFWHREFFWFTVVLALWAIYRHRTNIARLWAGTEHRIGAGKS